MVVVRGEDVGWRRGKTGPSGPSAGIQRDHQPTSPLAPGRLRTAVLCPQGRQLFRWMCFCSLGWQATPHTLGFQDIGQGAQTIWLPQTLVQVRTGPRSR